MHTELIVVGAGPAGLAAAAAAVEAGLEVLVVDERLGPGGRVAGALGASGADAESAWLVPAFGDTRNERVDRLRDAANAATFLFNALVWGIFPGFTLAVTLDGRTRRVDADQVVLATGRHAVRSPFPGHHLPGVVTPLGLHHALAREEIDKRHRIAILGHGALADALAEAAKLHSNADVLRLSQDAGEPEEPGAPFPEPLVVEQADDRLRIDLGDGSGDSHEVDLLVVADAEGPAVELAQLAGCEHRFAGYESGFMPVVDATGATTIPGVFLAGSVLGTRNADESERSGAVAGLAAAVRAGRGDAQRLRAEAASVTSTAPARPSLVPASYRELVQRDDAVACRCIGTTGGDVAAAIHAGARSLDDVKRHAKAGMGPCQGRECHRAIVCLLDRIGGIDVATLQPMRARPPVRPLTAGAMYAEESQS